MYIAPIYTVNIHALHPYTPSIYMFIAPIYRINIHDIHFKDKNYNDHVFILIIYRNVNE
jgi:hypothetical protein